MATSDDQESRDDVVRQRDALIREVRVGAPWILDRLTLSGELPLRYIDVP